MNLKQLTIMYRSLQTKKILITTLLRKQSLQRPTSLPYPTVYQPAQIPYQKYHSASNNILTRPLRNKLSKSKLSFKVFITTLHFTISLRTTSIVIVTLIATKISTVLVTLINALEILNLEPPNNKQSILIIMELITIWTAIIIMIIIREIAHHKIGFVKNHIS